MSNATTANGKEAAYFGVPWEDAFGYAQAIKVGDTIYVSGQLSHDEKGNLIAPASLDEAGKPAEFSMMEEQMRTTYANAVKLLARFGASLETNAGEVAAVRPSRRSATASIMWKLLVPELGADIGDHTGSQTGLPISDR